MSVVNVRYQRWYCDYDGCRAKQTPHHHTQQEMADRVPPKGWVTWGDKDYCPKHRDSGPQAAIHMALEASKAGAEELTRSLKRVFRRG